MPSFFSSRQKRKQTPADASSAAPGRQEVTIPVNPVPASDPCGADCLLRQIQRESLERFGQDSLLEPLEQDFGVPGALSEADRTISRSLYQPLKPWQTRLIELLPGDQAARFPSCKLFTVDVIDGQGVGIPDTGEIVMYNAISYVWGQTALDSAIICNTTWLPFCKSLASALAALFASGAGGYYWVDAVCIDQENLTERALQVRNMLRIFEKADSIVAWMGSFDSQHVPHLRFLSRLVTEGGGFTDAALTAVHTKECLKAWYGLLRTLNDFRHRPWFARTWIRQEVFAAKAILFYFDCFKIAVDLRNPDIWTELHSQLRDIIRQDHIVSRPVPLGPLGIPNQFRIMCNHFHHNGTDEHNYTAPQTKLRHSLYWLRTLQQGTNFAVADPRDRIYALLGVLLSPTTRLYVETPSPEEQGQRQESAFPVDYNKSVAEVYGDVVKYLINMNRNLDCLCVLQDRRNQASDMPSWVLDWRDDRPRYFIETKPESIELKDFIGHPPKQDLNETSVLRISGFTACSIQRLTVDSSLDPPRRVHTQNIYLYEQDIARFDADVLQQSYVDGMCDKETCGLEFTFRVLRNSMLDDEIVFAQGARRPLVLRYISKGRYLFIGPALCRGTTLSSIFIAEFDKIGLRPLPSELKVVCPDWKQKSNEMKTYQLV